MNDEREPTSRCNHLNGEGSNKLLVAMNDEQNPSGRCNQGAEQCSEASPPRQPLITEVDLECGNEDNFVEKKTADPTNHSKAHDNNFSGKKNELDKVNLRACQEVQVVIGKEADESATTTRYVHHNIRQLSSLSLDDQDLATECRTEKSKPFSKTQQKQYSGGNNDDNNYVLTNQDDGRTSPFKAESYKKSSVLCDSKQINNINDISDQKATVDDEFHMEDRHVGERNGEKEINTNIIKDRLKSSNSTPTWNWNFVISAYEGPCPFEAALEQYPNTLLTILNFLGDPQAICRMKIVNSSCNKNIRENEHVIFRDAVRLGGLSMHLRPAFWMWLILERVSSETPSSWSDDIDRGEMSCVDKLFELERIGREGDWHHVIERDVARAFGYMPPHKTGSRLNKDSIVRALVTWGRGRVVKRGVKGGGDTEPTSSTIIVDGQLSKSNNGEASPWDNDDDDSSQASDAHTTVSDWSGISPVASFASNCSDTSLRNTSNKKNRRERNKNNANELALSGNSLTSEMKAKLQNKLAFILHALAAAHEDVGYCQGMDYVVAHLLRVLQDTILFQEGRGMLPRKITQLFACDDPAEEQVRGGSLVIEETVFLVMDTFLTHYNLRHMYWPELRCLKTCCRVFEKLIQKKLPVLADHFDHHELNIGMFALGWFQTLFLYLPSMPSATVCHMWDIWLVERSFKIFFRVGTAILFLSQPTLLNHELEGMMTYLNTFPDATLLNPDILIACALQIKVTNKMLVELEEEVTGGF